LRTCRSTVFALLSLTLLAIPAWPQGGPGLPIDQGLWRLNGTDPDLPHYDLEPLRRIVGGAQFVALGESTHASGGYYEMKHRTFRFLVEQMGFRAFGMETPWVNAERTARYVQTCQGTPNQALRGIFPVWRSTETQALVRWMCDWNQAHPDDRVHFYGFDIQAQDNADVQALLAFLQRLGVGEGDPRVTGIRVCDNITEDWYFQELPYPPELYEQCHGALKEVAAYFDAQEKDIERRTSREDLAWTRIHLVGLQAWQDEMFYDLDPERSQSARDQAMAYVAQAIRDLRFPQARTVLWAHNGHIARAGIPFYFLDNMGGRLATELGNKYMAIGLTAREPRVDWWSLGLCGPIDQETGPGSLEHVLSVAAPGTGVLADLRAHPPFLTPGAMYRVGGASIVPADHFDAMIHLDVSPEMHPTFWPACQ
jgi:erythromycin esterase